MTSLPLPWNRDVRRSRVVALIVAVALGALGATPGVAGDPKTFDSWGCAPMDWPNWRGPEYNGISREKNLPAKWSPGGENVIWQKPELATRSTPIVMNGKLYFLQNDRPSTPDEGEKVVCADAATGDVIWQTRFNVFLSAVPDTRVAWSSVVGDPETGNVYAQGVCGTFLCLEGETGRIVWERSMSEEFGALNTYGGRTNFPVIYDDLVIISAVIIGWGEMAQPAHRFLAFDKRTGVSRWFASTRLRPEDTTYSTPIPTVINGEAALVFGAGDGSVYAFQPRTGKKIWNYDVSNRGINTTPLVVGSTIFAGHSEENLDDISVVGAFFALDGSKAGDITKSGELWRVKELGIGRVAPLSVDGILYVVDDAATLIAVDPKTGKTVGKKQKLGTVGWGSPVYADGKIYVCERNGRWFTFEIGEDGLKRVHTERLTEEVNASPIISHGRIYLATNQNMYCIGLPDVKPEADPRPEAPRESPVSDDRKPAQLQVVPVESLLKPGESQPYDVRLFNARGQFLGTAGDMKSKIQFSLAGPGEFDAAGKYVAPAKSGQAAVIVTAKVGDVSGTARIRVVPTLPWSYDFDDGDIPITWNGIRYRHIPLDADLFLKLRKENTLAADLYIYFNSTFTNANLTKAKYQDVGPVQRWTELLRFTELAGKVTSLDDAKAALDPAVQLLVKEKVLAKAMWGSEGGSFLAVEQGPRKIEGNGVMCKITTIPRGTKSQGWMGHTDFRNYTIQADGYGTSVASSAEDPTKKMPDMGVIAQRYRLDLIGAHQELVLRSWTAHEIKFKRVPFAWQPDVWYTMKLQASTEDRDGREVAVLKGKVWKRGETEPGAWTIEWTDTPANTHGSPGLTGGADNAEVFFDNVKVFPNTPAAAAK